MKKITFFCAICLIAFSAPSQIINTIAGTGVQGYSGDGGQATAAELDAPFDVCTDAAGNLYISDYNSNRIRKVNVAGVISTFAGNGTASYSGDGGPATAAEINMPTGITIDDTGNLYIADWANNRIRKVNTAGVIRTVAGTGTAGFSGDGGPATAAKTNVAGGVAFDGSGNMYICDDGNYRIRMVNTLGVISTIAGTGVVGYSGDGGPATAAELSYPVRVCADAAGNIYISDNGSYTIRMVNTSGVISTLAGTGTMGYTGDGGPATAAELGIAEGVSVDALGDVYVADMNNSVIRMINTGGIISTVAGNGGIGYSGDGGPATAAKLFFPPGVYISSLGNLYIADESNSRVREVPGFPTIIASVKNTNRGKVYPNPTSTQLFVDLGKTTGKTTLALYSLTGQKVLEQVYSGLTTVKLDISAITNGIYILKVQNTDGTRSMDRVEIIK